MTESLIKYSIGEAYAYCVEVWSEAKPMANFEVNKEDMPEIISIISSYELKYKTTPSKWNKNKVVFWVYKYYHLGLVLDAILTFGDNLSTYQHWVLGKLFGYSEKAIEEFLERGKDDL